MNYNSEPEAPLAEFLIQLLYSCLKQQFWDNIPHTHCLLGIAQEELTLGTWNSIGDADISHYIL